MKIYFLLKQLIKEKKERTRFKDESKREHCYLIFS